MKDYEIYNITPMARTRKYKKKKKKKKKKKIKSISDRGWLVYRGWNELFFQSLQNSSSSSRKQIFKVFFFLFFHGIVCCVYSLESPDRGDSNEYTQHRFFFFFNRCVENRKDFPKLSLLGSWTGAMINPQWLKLPMSRTNSMVPKMFEPLRFDYTLIVDCVNQTLANHSQTE